MVPIATEISSGSPSKALVVRQSSDTSAQRHVTPIREQITFDGLSFVREVLRQRGVPEEVFNTILSSWAIKTRKQYFTYLKKWNNFCHKNKYDCFSPSVAIILQFLQNLVDGGGGFSAINTARSALSAVFVLDNNETIGDNKLISRFVKGMYKLKPPVARYTNTWDVNLVLQFFKKQPLPEFLSLYDLSLRVVMLLALTTAQRCQSLHLLDLDHMTKDDSKFVFRLTGNFKQARPKFNTLSIVVPKYPADSRICAFTNLEIYIKTTEKFRSSSYLFISTMKPHSRASKDTISRWIKTVMKGAGIDTNVFKPHSCRAASTSAAARKDVDIETIMKTAGWTNAVTFANFYNKPLIDGSSKFADKVLSA